MYTITLFPSQTHITDYWSWLVIDNYYWSRDGTFHYDVIDFVFVAKQSGAAYGNKHKIDDLIMESPIT